MKIDPKQYENVIVYGIGQYYERIKEDLLRCIKPDYLCDRKWELNSPESYEGIPIIKKNELRYMKNCLLIVTTGSPGVFASISSDLKGLGEDQVIVHVSSIMDISQHVTGKMLKGILGDGCYQDAWGNKIYYDETIPEALEIGFYGKNNTLVIGKNIIVNKLMLVFGNEGECQIGDRTEIVGGQFAISGAKLMIGEDCLFSTEIMVQNRDGHHIFDGKTHKRINYPRDIVIGNHVWIGCRALILAGARIGNGSIVGANAVTSGQFGENQILAGCPARVIREGVCWSKDSTDYFNHDYLEECINH